MSHYLNVPTQLLDTGISTKTTAFAGVPWVLECLINAWKNELGNSSFGKVVRKITSRSITFNHTMHIIINCLFRWALVSLLILVWLRQLWISAWPLFEAVLWEIIFSEPPQFICAIIEPASDMLNPCSLKSHAQLHQPIMVLCLPFASCGPAF